ncbi:MAG: hypothetical protein ACRDPD_29950 [Streptosporangiaceae bacterium]
MTRPFTGPRAVRRVLQPGRGRRAAPPPPPPRPGNPARYRAGSGRGWPRMRRHRLFVMAAGVGAGLTAAWLGVVLAACGAGPASGTGLPSDGPFGTGGTPGALCTPVPRGGVLSDGFEALENHGSSTARITRVTLAAPHQGLTVLAAYVIPVTGYTLYGALPGYPQAGQMPPGEDWPHRQLVAGAQVPAMKVANLLLVLKPASSGGTAGGIDVYYEAGGRQYLLRTATSLNVVIGPSCFPLPPPGSRAA